MKRLDKYNVDFKGLKEGEHFFEYDLTHAFFESFEAPQVENGHVKVKIKLTKSEQMLTFKFFIAGMIYTVCDRCLDSLKVPIDVEERLFVKFGETYGEPTDEIVILPHEAHAFNVARHIYEYIVTSLPISHVHPEKEDGSPGCNPEMLDHLNHYMVNGDSQAKTINIEEIDPRWEKLKNLNTNN